MSIACPQEDGVSSLVLVPVTRQKTTSQARIDANRLNARRSTGPKTPRGKARVAQNAVKHGLCATHVHLPEECAVTFSTFVREIEEELQPRTIFQRVLCSHIANLEWRLRRLPEAQAKLFAEERCKAMRDGEDPGTDEQPTIPPCEVLARRFSDEPLRNGFALLERYERGLSNRLLRLLNQYERLKKVRPTMPDDAAEMAIIERNRKRNLECEEERRQHEEHMARWQASPEFKRIMAEQERLHGKGKQTQSEPIENASGESETQKVDDSHDAPMTEQTQRAVEDPSTDRAPTRHRHFSGGGISPPENARTHTATEVTVPREPMPLDKEQYRLTPSVSRGICTSPPGHLSDDDANS